MGKQVLVIGGTRFFGRRLVERLLLAGHRVTIATRGRAVDAFGQRVQRIRVDRRDAAAMAAAFAQVEGYDLVYDQMCYSPPDAAIAAAVFGGRVGRYVMASTIEVYGHHRGAITRPLGEDDVDLDAEAIDPAFPWHDPAQAEAHYGRGKRQAEACLYRHGGLPVVSVRIAHVLAGPEDFTGRLARYVETVAGEHPLRHAAAAGASSFISAAGIADFLVWAGEGSFLGPINAAAEGQLSAVDLYRRAARVLCRPLRLEPVGAAVAPGELSPFDYPVDFRLDTGRARTLGYRFDHVDDWLDGLLRQHRRAA